MRRERDDHCSRSVPALETLTPRSVKKQGDLKKGLVEFLRRFASGCEIIRDSIRCVIALRPRVLVLSGSGDSSDMMPLRNASI